MTAPISTTSALERFAIKRGLTLGNLIRADMHVALALAAPCLPSAAVLTEAQVNAALQDWLAGTGAMLAVDHVELRRALIDAGLWQRDGFGRAYRRAETYADPELLGQVEALAALDAAQIIAAARVRDATERAQRRERHAG